MGYPETFDEIDRWCQELRRTHAGDGIIRAMEKRIEGESDPRRLEILNWFLANEHMAQGNEAAAGAVRRRNRTDDIYRWHEEWRQTRPEIDVIPAIEDRVQSETHPLRLHALRYLLAEEHRERGDYAGAEAAFLADFDANPEDPMPLIRLASQKLDDQNQPEAAMPAVERAVDVALRSGMFRRQALGVKARIALALGRHAVVEDVLRLILQLTFTRGNLDAGAERDFFDALPQGSIDGDVARAYDAYCREHGVETTASPQRIDALILACARQRWLKVARIMADVLDACKRGKIDIRVDDITKRVCVLVEQGKLEAQGNLYRPRHSEVKLPD
jgi:hypothetical protein